MASTTTNLLLKVWNGLSDVFNHTELSQNWTKIDEHDHTGAGKGLQIPAGGLAAASVLNANLAPNAVNASVIQDASITGAKLAPGYIADGSLSGAKLIDSSVQGGKLVNNSVDGVKLLDESVTIDKLAASLTGVLLPPGMIAPYGGTSAPATWALCDGTVVARAGTYASLFAVIGTAYNLGGESGSDFRLPDLRGRVPVGVDGAAARLTANDTLGKFAGEEKHILTTGEAAQKAVTTGQESASHRHGIGTTGAKFVHDTGGGVSASAAGGGGYQLSPLTNPNDTHHTHSIAGSSAASGHNNMQPYQIVNYIIKL